MARLNEAPQPSVESIDALKRRFVRQNREIARANSTQSLRIRNLESEVTRLLSENVSLREQVIRLHHEAEKVTGRAVLEGVDIVKLNLETKLAELGGLIQELGNVQKNIDSQQRRRKSMNRSSPKRSPDQKNWKNTLTLSEATGGTDGRLPPIVEDKYYPRRTMDADEFLDIFADPANATDSPDLGPPPVAHFEEGDPIKFDPTHIQGNPIGAAESVEGKQPDFLANLETRKKRRESSHRRDGDVKNASIGPTKDIASMATAMPMSQPLKSGAKRKLNIRDEESAALVDEPAKQNHHLSSRSSDPRMSENGNTKQNTDVIIKAASDKNLQAAITSISRSNGKERVSAPSAATGRRALGPKSINTDPTNSPAKASRFGKDKVSGAKDDSAKIVRERNRLKDKTRPKDPIITREPDAVTKGIEVKKPVEAPSETPAPLPLDLISPGPSEPSAARRDSRDTPPPPDLGPDTGTGSFGRASRRPRGSVNYAQPNLRDKMRRPTKELVDAVGAEERARIAQAENDASKPIVIKQEEDDADAIPTWKTNAPKIDERARPEPISPLGNKIGAADLPASVITERRRRTVVPALKDDIVVLEQPTSGAASAIAALAAGTQRSKRREQEEPDGDVERREQMGKPPEATSIYEFTGSSPIDSSGKHANEASKEELTKTMRSSRRHSSVPASSEAGKGSIVISRRGDRRRETIVVKEPRESIETGGEKKLGTANVLESSTGDEQAAAGRGERAASRRRSMMI